MISRELLSEVLGTKTIQMNPILENNNMVGYLVYGSQDTITQIRSNHKQINIYELAHKCKEWALSQGYYFELNICLSVVHLKLWKEVGITKLFKSFKGIKEIEVYYKACQWILDNKD